MAVENGSNLFGIDVRDKKGNTWKILGTGSNKVSAVIAATKDLVQVALCVGPVKIESTRSQIYKSSTFGSSGKNIPGF